LTWYNAAVAERRLYYPTDYANLEVSDGFIFLNGPIQGAPDWQKDAVDLIHATNPDIVIASPRRDYLPMTFDYPAQVNWETVHRLLASKSGVNLYWLAKELEDKHDVLRAYAQTTRFELAESKVRHEVYGEKMVIGIEKGFSGARYIIQRFEEDCPDVPIAFSLEATVKEAIGLIG